jgi:hypothetical protein
MVVSQMASFYEISSQLKRWGVLSPCAVYLGSKAGYE